MTIQIDDAGWGCLLGGVLIGCYRVETGEFTAHEIPVTDFQGECFTHRRYLSTAWVCAKRGLEVLRHETSEPIQVCQGFVNGEVRRKLRVPGIRITGPFQARIEKALLDYLNKLGFPYQGSTEEYGKLFFEALRWLKGGNPNQRGMLPERMRMAKTGWETFRFYRDLPYKEAANEAKRFKSRRRSSRWQNGGSDADD